MLNLFAQNETTVGNKDGAATESESQAEILFLLISHGNPPHNCVWNKQFAAIVCYVLFQARASQTEPSNACE